MQDMGIGRGEQMIMGGVRHLNVSSEQEKNDDGDGDGDGDSDIVLALVCNKRFTPPKRQKRQKTKEQGQASPHLIASNILPAILLGSFFLRMS